MDVTLLDSFILGSIISIAYLVIKFVVQGFSKAAADITHEEILKEVAKNVVILRVDTVQYQGKDVYLIYEATENKFITQGVEVPELVSRLIQLFQNKSVFLKMPNDELIPFNTLIGE